MENDMGKLPFDIDFHPSNPLVSADHRSPSSIPIRRRFTTTELCSITTTVTVGFWKSMPIANLAELFDSSTRVVGCFLLVNMDGCLGIVTGSPDCSILATDVETGSAIARLENSHGAAVNRIINLTESTIASGDDEGCIKVWDTRQCTWSNSFNAHEEYISDMTFAFDSMRLLGTSDRLVDLSPNSVDALLKLDEDRVISGSENGLIRIIQPIAEHSEYPVERLDVYWHHSFSHDKKFLGSISHGSYIEGIYGIWTIYCLVLEEESFGCGRQ
ncbi:unnamed protein product [Camellia sinensis]